jgi:4-hydroxy-tetrahydrodipicolinate synthase
MTNQTSSRPRLRGVFSPTLTAFHADGSINPEGTKKFVRFLLENHVDGLTPLGSGGEPIALDMKERMRLLDAIVEETAGQVPVFGGICEFSTAAAVELGLHAKSIGCDGLMIMPPFLLRPPKRDVLNHFRHIREKVGLPIMLYDVPATTGIEITPPEIKVLKDEDVIHAVKWSHTEVSRIQDTRDSCGPDFPIFAGNDVIAFGALALGADGWISGLPMIVPALAVRLFQLLAQDKKLEAARELWYRLVPIVQMEFGALAHGDWDPHIISLVRESALLRGLPVGRSRPPLTQVEPAVRDKLKIVLAALGQC